MEAVDIGCVYCGTSSNLTKEHAIPKQLFSSIYKSELSKKKKRLITVPSCAPCNAGFSSDEESFREFLLNLVGDGSSISSELLQVQRRAYSHAVGKAFKMRDKLKLVLVRFDDGSARNMVEYELPKKDVEMVRRVLKKIIQCLLFKHTGLRQGATTDFIVQLCDPTKETLPEEFFGTDFRWEEDYKEVCRYGYQLVPGSGDGIWILTFYSRATFWIVLKN